MLTLFFIAPLCSYSATPDRHYAKSSAIRPSEEAK